MTNAPASRPAFHATVLATVLVLAGCAGSSDKYPSLAIRDAERVTGQFSPGAPDDGLVAPVASAQDIAAILGTATTTHRRFLAAQPETQQLVNAARGSGPESDLRSRALVALANLTSLRGQTAIALSNLDMLETKAATAFAPTDAIRAAQAEVAMLVGEQDAALDSLGAQLR